MSWEKVKLGNVLKQRKGFIEIADEVEYKLCRVQVNRRGVVLRELLKGHQIRTKKQQICKAGDFIVAEMDAKVGGYGFVPDQLDQAIVSSHYFLFELDKTKIRPQYLEVVSQLNILQEQIKAVGSTNYAAIRPANVLSWEIPLPPIKKQIAIENVYSKSKILIDSIKKETLSLLHLLESLNQAILQEAVQGILVPQDPMDEPASELLRRHKAKISKSREKEKTIPPLKLNETPFMIPKGWTWCRIEEILNQSRGAMRRGPFGSSITKSMFINKSQLNATKIYEQKNAIYKNYELGEYYIDITKHANLLPFLAGPEDIIISCAGTIGETYLLPKEAPAGIINQALLKIRLNKKLILNQYFLYCFKATMQQKVNSDAKGTAMKNLGSIKYLKEFLLIPLPPHNEQLRIVTEIDRQLALTKQLKENIIINQEDTEKLLKAILHEAFKVGN